MKNIFIIIFLFFSVTLGIDLVVFDTKWIPAKPEVMTYRSTDQNGTGLYQVSVSKKNDIFEVYVNIIYPGFTKTVSGTFNSSMEPLKSKSKIIVDGQIVMDTECFYNEESLSISTLMSPYNKTMAQNINLKKPVIDFSQIPVLLRTLHLKKDKQFKFSSLNPQTNSLVPLTIKVIGEDSVKDIDCYKVELIDFEGKAIYWIEKGESHRILLVEQLETHRITELLI